MRVVLPLLVGLLLVGCSEKKPWEKGPPGIPPKEADDRGIPPIDTETPSRNPAAPRDPSRNPASHSATKESPSRNPANSETPSRNPAAPAGAQDTPSRNPVKPGAGDDTPSRNPVKPDTTPHRGIPRSRGLQIPTIGQGTQQTRSHRTTSWREMPSRTRNSIACHQICPLGGLVPPRDSRGNIPTSNGGR